ncbi:MAG: carboxypeptidase regulatory-like domain-containing protein [Vulcanimicrobiaceae bacterium]
MIDRAAATALALVLLLCSISSQALAQSDSGEIRIVVDDGATKQPLELARVLLDGPVITSEVTGKNGQVRFTDVPDGIYRARIFKGGYQPVTSENFEVVNGRSVVVTVLLAGQAQLKVIGTVTSHSSASISNGTITNDSAQRKLSSDLADALNKLSGVSVSTSSDDSDATQTISLEGQDPSQTQLTLDGIPLNAPGTAGNLGAFATDLFGSASVRNGPQLGGLAGGVNFSTLQPTLSWLSQALISTGSNGRHNYSFAQSGSVGNLGIAVQSVKRLNTSLVDGELYQDASGLDYVHNGDSSIGGNLVRLRYQAGEAQTITGTFLNSTRSTNLVCLRISGAVPCGYGPDNTSDGSSQLYSLNDDALIGATSVSASLFSSDFKNDRDQLARYVDGIAQPTGFFVDARSTGYTVNVTLPAKVRHTISIQAYGTSSSGRTRPLVSQAAPYYTGSQQSNFSALQVNDSIHSSDKLSLSDSVGVNSASGSSSALATLGAAWRPTSKDTLAASYSIGGVAASGGRATILSDPASLRFDCNGSVAYGNAPGDQPGASSSISTRLSYMRALHAGSVSFSVYRQLQRGVVLPTQVNGSALEALGVISPAYIAAAQQVYDSPAGCDATTPLAASQLYFSTPVGGVERIYEGAAISGYVTLGRLVVQPFYDLTVAKAVSSDPRIDNRFSITISGAQLPNVPMQRAGIVFDYKAPGSILEWLADAQYTGTNNRNNLPAYTTYDAGVSAQLRYGTLTVAANNLSNAYSGIFASPQNAVPYVTLGGRSIATTARPLAPRSYSFTYAVKFGPGARGSTQSGSAFAPHERGGFGGPGGPGGPERRGRGFRRLFTPLPSVPPADPFAVSTVASEFCNEDAAKTAQNASQELRSVVARIQAAKTANGYPAIFAVPALDDMTLTYHGLGKTYALTITQKFAPAVTAAAQRDRGGMRAFAGCMTLHLARPSEVQSRGLYAPAGAIPFFVPQVQFMPAVGMYIAVHPPQPGQETFRVYQLPSTPPAAPFGVRAAAGTCVGDVRNTAQQALSELQRYFKNGTSAPSWTISAHPSRGGTWYDVAPGDPTIVGSLLVCGRIATGTPEQLQQRGFGGQPLPELNYASPLGLYLVRPARPPRPENSPSPAP